MSEPKIIKLTREQEDLIPVYQDKWKQIILSTERINRDVTIDTIKQVYTTLMNLPEPEIFFYESLYAIGFEDKNLIDLHQICNEDFTCEVISSIESHLRNQILKQIKLESQENFFWEFNVVEDVCSVFFQITSNADTQLSFELDKYRNPVCWSIKYKIAQSFDL